jgi:hypothetical protein
VLLPSHGLRDLRESGAVLALQHGDHLGGLAALARCGDFRRLGSLLGRGRLLGGGGLVGCLALDGCALGRLCATLGAAFGVRLRGLCRLRGRGESLNALSDTGSGGFVVLELLDGLDAWQAAPNREQPLRRPPARSRASVPPRPAPGRRTERATIARSRSRRATTR